MLIMPAQRGQLSSAHLLREPYEIAVRQTPRDWSDEGAASIVATSRGSMADGSGPTRMARHIAPRISAATQLGECSLVPVDASTGDPELTERE